MHFLSLSQDYIFCHCQQEELVCDSRIFFSNGDLVCFWHSPSIWWRETFKFALGKKASWIIAWHKIFRFSILFCDNQITLFAFSFDLKVSLHTREKTKLWPLLFTKFSVFTGFFNTVTISLLSKFFKYLIFPSTETDSGKWYATFCIECVCC